MKALQVLHKHLDLQKEQVGNWAYQNCEDSRDMLDSRVIELEEAIKELEDLTAKDNQKNCEECYDKADKALTAIESQSSCDGCIHKPKQGENYYDPCGECKRFYADMHTRTEEDEDVFCYMHQ